MKVSLCLRTARILNTLHGLLPQIAHGQLTSHNLMLDLEFNKNPSMPFRLFLTELELEDFKKYANMFSSYRCASVWSAPEVLKQPRKKMDPTPEMDVYSFGMLMWEIFHETVPFDGDLKVCSDYVINSESRPMIDEEGNMRRATDFENLNIGDRVPINERLAEVIRLCWQTHPDDRPKMEMVCQRLSDELWLIVNKEDSMIIETLEENGSKMASGEVRSEVNEENFATAIEPESPSDV